MRAHIVKCFTWQVIDVLGNLAEMKAAAQKQPTEGMTLGLFVCLFVFGGGGLLLNI